MVADSVLDVRARAALDRPCPAAIDRLGLAAHTPADPIRTVLLDPRHSYQKGGHMLGQRSGRLGGNAQSILGTPKVCRPVSHLPVLMWLEANEVGQQLPLGEIVDGDYSVLLSRAPSDKAATPRLRG